MDARLQPATTSECISRSKELDSGLIHNNSNPEQCTNFSANRPNRFFGWDLCPKKLQLRP
jgi:hypothetical protein